MDIRALRIRHSISLLELMANRLTTALIVVSTVGTAAGELLAVAAVQKTRDFSAFVSTARGIGLPGFAARPVAAGFIGAEALAAALIISGQLPVLASAAGVAVGVALTGVSAYSHFRRFDLQCNCFGSTERKLGSGTLGLASVLLVVMAAVLLGHLFLGGRPAPAKSLPLIVDAGALLLTVGVMLRSLPLVLRLVGQRRGLQTTWAAYASLD